MGKFSAITCDHCDARDIVDYPPQHKIETVTINGSLEGGPYGEFISMKTDLCETCRNTLKQTIFDLMHQVPRAA